MRRRPKLVVAVLLASCVLAGCAGDPHARSGVEWIEQQNAERARMEAMGFPQFTGAN